jgi:hypothetical protein
MRYLKGLALVTAASVGCTSGTIDIYTCDEQPTSESEPHCCPKGECVPMAPLGWEGPVLLWEGAEEDAPGCPARAAVTLYEGHGGLLATPQCPTCWCEPAPCVLSGLVASDSFMCAPGAPEAEYPAPNGWQGECVSPATVPASQLGSISFPPPSLAPCVSVTGPVITQGNYGWGTFARACGTAIPLVQCDGQQLCVPTSEPPPPGFRQCVFARGEQECPARFPDRHMYYNAIDESEVECSACACTDPEGGDCQALVHAFADAMCADELGSVMVTLASPQCVDPPDGSPLSAMAAEWIVTEPGSCIPQGGQPIGSAKPADPATFCCE